MERSPILPLHFADENLKPRASCGLNTFVDHFAGAMKRSTSPITGSKSEPQLIETAPRDGGFLIIEENISGKNDIARWASEAGGWVRENGEPIKIRPSYWYPIEGENYLQHGPDVSISPSQRGAAPQQHFASEFITSLWERLLPRPATAKIGSHGGRTKARLLCAKSFGSFLHRCQPCCGGMRRHVFPGGPELAAIFVAGTRPGRRTGSRTQRGHRGSGSAWADGKRRDSGFGAGAQ